MSNKLKSRKFIVFIVGCLFVGLTMFITKTVTPELINFMLFNNMFYISGNVAKAYLNKKKE